MPGTPNVKSVDEVDRSTARRELGGLSSLVFVAYLTTFLRDSFIVARSAGNSLVDPAVLALSTGSTIAAFFGLVLVLNYGSGSAIRYMHIVVSVVVVSAIAYPVAPFAGFAGLVAASLVIFHISQTYAASSGKLLQVTIGNVVSSIFSIGIWLTFGLERVHSLLLGYLLGPVTQMCVAAWCGRGAPRAGRVRSIDVPFWRIVVLAGVTQVAPFAARLAFVGQPTGEVAIASFVLTVVASMTVVLAAPTATLRLAGRPSPPMESVVRLAWKFTGVAMCGIVLVLFLGSTDRLSHFFPERFFHLTRHSFFVVPAMPAATYLYLRVRSRGDGSHNAMFLSIVSGSLAVQVVLSVLAVRLPAGRGYQWLPYTLTQHFAMVLDQRSRRSQKRESNSRRI